LRLRPLAFATFSRLALVVFGAYDSYQMIVLVIDLDTAVGNLSSLFRPRYDRYLRLVTNG